MYKRNNEVHSWKSSTYYIFRVCGCVCVCGVCVCVCERKEENISFYATILKVISFTATLNYFCHKLTTNKPVQQQQSTNV